MKKFVIAILNGEARIILRKYKPFVVAVTGSVGKTSTKDALYDMFRAYPDSGFVRKAEKSFNSEIGTPLTIIGVPNAWRNVGGWLSNMCAGLRLIYTRQDYPHTLLLEIGADHPGDIRRVTTWLKPDIAVITRVSRTPVHVEFFKSPEEVFEEKAALATAVKDGGTLVVFGDDERTLSMGDRVKVRGVSVVSYGLTEGVTVRGACMTPVYENNMPVGMTFSISAGGQSAEVTVRGVIGAGAMYSTLAAAAVGFATRPNAFADTVVPALQHIEFPKGRMNLIPGLNGSTLIDDTYNSSPDAVSAALETLASLPGRKIAALGDMLELGKFTSAEHRKVGAEAARVAQILVTVGQRSKLTAEEAARAGIPADAIRSFDSSREAAAYLASIVGPGDIVLTKGSQSIRMERVSAALLREPEKAGTLLVRQEPEWLAKP